MKYINKNVDLSKLYLTSLPEWLAEVEIRGSFWCYNNQLTSLAGAPAKVQGNFYCENNRLTSLAGAPAKVHGDFFCYNNQLTSLAGAPAKVQGDFYCENNPGKFTEEDVRKVCKVKGEVYC